MDLARDVAVIQVIDTAKPPEKRSNKRALPAIMAGMLTFFLIIFVILGREQLRNRTIGEDEAKKKSILKDYLTPWRKR